MHKIVRTIIGTNGIRPWFPEEEYQTYFTQSEIDVLNDAKTFTNTLSGFINYNLVEDTQNNTITIELIFDTEENLQDALSKLHGANPDDIIKQRNTIIKAKQAELNIQSTFSHSWE